MISTEKLMNTKVVELIKSTTFILVIFSSDKVIVTLFTNFTYLSYSNIVYETIREICEICEQWYYHFVGRRNNQNKSCRSCWVLQLLCSWLFEFTSFGVSKICLNVSFIEIQNLNCSNLVTLKYDQNKSCRDWWVLQLWYSSLFQLKSFGVSKSGLNLSFF